jgi:hypothetical protein
MLKELAKQLNYSRIFEIAISSSIYRVNPRGRISGQILRKVEKK